MSIRKMCEVTIEEALLGSMICFIRSAGRGGFHKAPSQYFHDTSALKRLFFPGRAELLFCVKVWFVVKIQVDVILDRGDSIPCPLS